jgi:hypothetical protein
MATKKIATKSIKSAGPKSKASKATGVGVARYLGKKIILKCMNYFYYGTVREVDAFCAVIDDAYAVFETGSFEDTTFKDAQRIGDHFCVTLQSIEAFGPSRSTPKAT